MNRATPADPGARATAATTATTAVRGASNGDWPAHPTGTVTFLFTDIEGSTILLGVEPLRKP